MVVRRQCAFQLPGGKPCRAAPLLDSEFCFMHSPERVKERQDARRLGGLRRRRESTISVAYQFESLSNLDGIRRVVEVAIIDTLSLDNGVARNRALASLALVALKTLEVGNLEERIAALEELTRGKR